MSSVKIRNPLQFISENFDWEAYVTEHYDYKMARQDTEYRVQCPYDDCDDCHHKMYINPDQGKFHCFKCKKGRSGEGAPVSFVRVTEDLDYTQAIRQLLAELADLAVEYEILEENLEGWDDVKDVFVARTQIRFIEAMPQESMLLQDPNHIIQKPFFRYLLGRGLTHDEITDMQVRCVPKSECALKDAEGNYLGDIGKRILWPIYGGVNPGLVSWDSRVIHDRSTSVKYLKCPDADHAHTVWPFVRPYGDTAVLVEGILDCYAVRRIPTTSAYATFSKVISEQQIALLKMWGIKKVILFWDLGDAKPQMIRAVEDLKLHFEVFVASQDGFLGDYDCGDTLRDPEGLLRLRTALRPIDVYSWDFEIWKSA